MGQFALGSWIVWLSAVAIWRRRFFSDEEVFEQIKPKSRKAYEKCWKELKEF